MRFPISRITKVFFTPETFLPFLLGSIFLAVLGNAITQLLFNLFGTSTLPVLGIALGAVIIFISSALLFSRGLRQLDPPSIPNRIAPRPRRGLILLVSRAIPCRTAIEYHRSQLQYCWLLCSKDSKPIAEALEQDYATQNIRFRILVINDIYDPLDYCQEIRRIYQNLPPNLTPQDVIADYTGMTAHGSVGVVLASLEPRSPLQYTPAAPDSKQSLQPIEITLRSTRSSK